MKELSEVRTEVVRSRINKAYRSKQRWAESKVTCSRWIALTSHIGMHLLANMLLKLVELREGNFLSIYKRSPHYASMRALAH